MKWISRRGTARARAPRSGHPPHKRRATARPAHPRDKSRSATAGNRRQSSPRASAARRAARTKRHRTPEAQGTWPSLSDTAITRGVAATQWPGRWTTLPPACVRRFAGPGAPEVLLDAAHNPAAAEVLAQGLRRALPPDRPLAVVMGALRDKSPSGMVRIMSATLRLPAFERQTWRGVRPPRAGIGSSSHSM